MLIESICQQSFIKKHYQNYDLPKSLTPVIKISWVIMN